MQIKILNQETYATTTINSATNTAAVYAPSAEHVCYVVVASSASAPVGTTIQIQGSLDGTNYVALGSAISITGNGNFTANITAPNSSYIYYRLAYARTSGSYVANTTVVTKGDQV